MDRNRLFRQHYPEANIHTGQDDFRGKRAYLYQPRYYKGVTCPSSWFKKEEVHVSSTTGSALSIKLMYSQIIST